MKQKSLAHDCAKNKAQNSKCTPSTGTGTHLLAAEVDLAAKLGGQEVLAGLVQLLLCRGTEHGSEGMAGRQQPGSEDK